MLEQHVTSAPVTSSVHEWAEYVRHMPLEPPSAEKIRALSLDCLALQLVFPKVSQTAHTTHGRQLRLAFANNALEFLRKKRQSLLWKVTGKEVDFDHAYLDYVNWKKEHKGLSLATATRNCVEDYIADGLSKHDAEKAVSISILQFPSYCIAKLEYWIYYCRCTCRLVSTMSGWTRQMRRATKPLQISGV